MDNTAVFGTAYSGSNPDGDAKQTKKALTAFFVYNDISKRK